MSPLIRLSLLIVILSLTACTFRVRDSNVVIPRVAPAADIDAFRKQLPQYRIDQGRIPTSDGAELYSLRFLHSDAVATVL